MVGVIKAKHLRFLIDMDALGENLERQSECCIYRVPISIREDKEKAYTPKMISIGPFHHGKEELAAMEKQKLRYNREFSKRISEHKWQEIEGFVGKHEQRIRSSYDETFNDLEILDFAAMVLDDSIFIIEFLLKAHYDMNACDFLVDKANIRSTIWMDLQLLENQLPYFVLEEIYLIAFLESRCNNEKDPSNRCYPSFLWLSYLFISSVIDNVKVSGMPMNGVEVKHFTDLRRYIMTRDYKPKEESAELITGLPCIVKLHQSGVRVKCKEGDDRQCLLHISFETKKRTPIPWFEVHELQIPRIALFANTESLVRNVMAFEQCHYPSTKWHVCNYFQLMDILIDTVEDVDLLVEAGVIINHLGDDARAVSLFNSICRRTIIQGCYQDVVKDLKAHYRNPWNHTKATLRRTYFRDLWSGTATFAAALLVLLTLIQAICSIISVM